MVKQGPNEQIKSKGTGLYLLALFPASPPEFLNNALHFRKATDHVLRARPMDMHHC